MHCEECRTQKPIRAGLQNFACVRSAKSAVQLKQTNEFESMSALLHLMQRFEFYRKRLLWFDLMQYRFTIWLPKWIARRKNKWLSLTYVEATFSMSSGILNSLDEAVVLLARTQNVTKTRRFCVVLINTNAVLSVSLQPREENTNKFEIRTSNFYLSVFLNFSIRFFIYLFNFFCSFSRSHFKKMIYWICFAKAALCVQSKFYNFSSTIDFIHLKIEL